jgi:hypothetical protein
MIEIGISKSSSGWWWEDDSESMMVQTSQPAIPFALSAAWDQHAIMSLPSTPPLVFGWKQVATVLSFCNSTSYSTRRTMLKLLAI